MTELEKLLFDTAGAVEREERAYNGRLQTCADSILIVNPPTRCEASVRC